MKFGNTDINVKDIDWSKVTWKDFLVAYEHSLKGNVIETPEVIGKALGVKVPEKPKVKSGDA